MIYQKIIILYQKFSIILLVKENVISLQENTLIMVYGFNIYDLMYFKFKKDLMYTHPYRVVLILAMDLS